MTFCRFSKPPSVWKLYSQASGGLHKVCSSHLFLWVPWGLISHYPRASASSYLLQCQFKCPPAFSSPSSPKTHFFSGIWPRIQVFYLVEGTPSSCPRPRSVVCSAWNPHLVARTGLVLKPWDQMQAQIKLHTLFAPIKKVHLPSLDSFATLLFITYLSHN